MGITWPVPGFRGRRGAALLIVLWLSAALSAIAFALAGSVRGEVERTTTALEGARAYYLATGAIERALLYIQWGQMYRFPDGSSPYYTPGMPALRLPFPSGEALVEVIPETAKMNLNSAPPEDLYRLLLNLGAGPEQAREITLGIADWRSPAPAGPTLFDHYYLSLRPSFQARHASFEETEELLHIKGMTPELFYGSYERDPEGRLIPRPGLKDCVSVYGTPWQFDINTAEPAVLAAVGVAPHVIAALVEARRRAPFRNPAQFMAFVQEAGPAGQRLRLGGTSMFTLRATARLRAGEDLLSDQRRTVAALVKLNPSGYAEPYHVLRWYDHVWVQ
jgi:general secretion pathway protein K